MKAFLSTVMGVIIEACCERRSVLYKRYSPDAQQLHLFFLSLFIFLPMINIVVQVQVTCVTASSGHALGDLKQSASTRHSKHEQGPVSVSVLVCFALLRAAVRACRARLSTKRRKTKWRPLCRDRPLLSFFFSVWMGGGGGTLISVPAIFIVIMDVASLHRQDREIWRVFAGADCVSQKMKRECRVLP